MLCVVTRENFDLRRERIRVCLKVQADIFYREYHEWANTCAGPLRVNAGVPRIIFNIFTPNHL